MTIANYSSFHRFRKLIHQLPYISTNTIMDKSFLLEHDEETKIDIYYAPFEYVNEHAKIVIVGITPGLFQMEQSYQTVFQSKETDSDESILSKVKNAASFKGNMRKNLINMLDELALHQYLKLGSTSELFNHSSHLVHTTSVLSYPVFYKGANYSGTTPNMLTHHLLKRYVKEHLALEFAQLQNPLIIPLGVKVEKSLEYLAHEGIISANSILSGFPHPSGQNGWRKRHFVAAKENMESTLALHFHKTT